MYEKRSSRGNIKQTKTRSNPSWNESTTRWAEFSMGNQHSGVHFVFPCISALLISFSCSANGKHCTNQVFSMSLQVPVPSAHKAHHPPFGAVGFHTWNCSGLYSVCLHCSGTWPTPAEPCAHHPNCCKTSHRHYTAKPLHPNPSPQPKNSFSR